MRSISPDRPEGSHPVLSFQERHIGLRAVLRWVGRMSFAGMLSVSLYGAQTDSFKKNFNLFREVAPGVDFFAASKSDTAPFERPVREAQKKLASLIGRKLSRGVVVVCTTMEQKDSVLESRLLKLGYSWALIQLTPAAMAERITAEMKSRMGNMTPPGVLEMMRNGPPEQKAADDARMAGPVVQKVCFALLETTLMPEKAFKSSRVDDLSRSPLADWLDVGLAWYASGTGLNMAFLQQHLDEAFPLEDVLSMPRPFVALPSNGGSGGGAVFIQMAGGGPAPAGAGQQQTQPAPPVNVISGGSPALMGPVPAGGVMGATAMPKDVQDRMIFDSQAASFFSFALGTLGVEKIQAVIQSNLEGKQTRETLSLPDYLGPDMDKVEENWREWVKAQKAEEPMMFRINAAPAPVRP